MSVPGLLYFSFIYFLFGFFMKNCIVIYFDDEDKDSIIKFLDSISPIAEWFKIHFKKDFANEKIDPDQ